MEFVNRFLVVLQMVALIAVVGGTLTLVWVVATNNYELLDLSEPWEALGFVAFPLGGFSIITGARYVAEGQLKLLPWNK